MAENSVGSCSRDRRFAGERVDTVQEYRAWKKGLFSVAEPAVKHLGEEFGDVRPVDACDDDLSTRCGEAGSGGEPAEDTKESERGRGDGRPGVPQAEVADPTGDQEDRGLVPRGPGPMCRQ